MMKVNVRDAKAHLSEYLRRLIQGKEDVVIVCIRNVPVAELRPIAAARTTPRPIGLERERFQVPPSFFQALPEDIVGSFAGNGD